MKRIAIFCDYFPPAFKAGGPVKSLFLLSLKISESCKTNIYTNNCDIDNKKLTLEEIQTVHKSLSNNASIKYLSKDFSSYLTIFINILNNKWDAIYLNSFFSFKYTIYILLIIKIFRPKIFTVLAPRGELSNAALRQRRFKKLIYLLFYRYFLHRDTIRLHFTSEEERLESLSVFGSLRPEYFVLGNMIDDSVSLKIAPDSYMTSNRGVFRMVYFSRIAKKKNLAFLITMLHGIKISACLDIFGYIDDNEYWDDCKHLIKNLPESCSVNYMGVAAFGSYLDVLKDYDLFLLPTLNENFGHAILESLRAGTPVLISKFTPWHTSVGGAVTAIELNLDTWREFVHNYQRANRDTVLAARREALEIYSIEAERCGIGQYLHYFNFTN